MWETGVIFLGLNIIGMMNSAKIFLKRRYFYRLRNSIAPKVYLNAVRGGAKCKILGEDLLVGDVVEVQEGMVLPVDAILVEGSLRVGEENGKPKDVPQTYYPDEGRCPFLMSSS
jgi:Ca2+-transporting ATPase